MRVWIETSRRRTIIELIEVTLRVRVWIETRPYRRECESIRRVTLRVRVWIETVASKLSLYWR